MGWEEVDIFLQSFDEDYRQHKEELRLLGWWILASHSTKKIQLKDVMQFEWDREQKKEIKKMPKEQFEELKKQYQNILNNGR